MQPSPARSWNNMFDRELLGIFEALRNLWYIVDGRQLIIYTNNKPLTSQLFIFICKRPRPEYVYKITSHIGFVAGKYDYRRLTLSLMSQLSSLKPWWHMLLLQSYAVAENAAVLWFLFTSMWWFPKCCLRRRLLCRAILCIQASVQMICSRYVSRASTRMRKQEVRACHRSKIQRNDKVPVCRFPATDVRFQHIFSIPYQWIESVPSS